MKKMLLLLVATLCFGLNVFSQNEKPTITLRGKSDDPTILAKKRQFEGKGFTVVIEDDTSNPLLTGGDKVFRARHLDKPLKPFKLRDINGKLISSESLKGKMVHINFWSITCSACIAEFPELNALKEKYQPKSKDVVFLSIAPESEFKVRKVLKRKPLDYNVIANAQKYFDELGIDGYPKNFFIDKEGIIRVITDGTSFIQDEKTKKMIPNNFKTYDEIMNKMN